jgi:ABC-type transport system involved in multi-copper enzyme maturation permease subunit
VTTAVLTAAPESVWPLRRRQLLGVMRLELARSLRFWSAAWMLGLAFAPAVIICAHALHDRGCQLAQETYILGGIIQIYHVRFAVFFGCLGVFVRLIRGEIGERTLHYLFLASLRREVVVLGKFLAGALTTLLFFGTGVAVCFALMYGHFEAGREFLRNGPGLAHLAAYLGVVALACLGYGAVFLALSLVFKNPIVPAIVVLLWEGINGFLPVSLKHASVTFYLKPLMPVELPVEGISGLFTVVAEPTTPWVAVTGLLVFVLAVLAFACWRIRTLEISYAAE